MKTFSFDLKSNFYAQKKSIFSDIYLQSSNNYIYAQPCFKTWNKVTLMLKYLLKLLIKWVKCQILDL